VTIDAPNSDLIDYLLDRGRDHMAAPRVVVRFTADDAANEFINDLEGVPQAFVLACLLDRQMPAEKVWAMPYAFRQALGAFDMQTLSAVPPSEWETLLRRSGHRFPERMSSVLSRGIERMVALPGSDASALWSDQPSSARLVRRFLAFHGAGPKIATMAVNILVRDFKVPIADHRCIDVSADVQVNRVMARLGLVSSPPDVTDVIYAARELSPEFPGLLDLTLWSIGRDLCRPQKPRCDQCPLHAWCHFVT